LAIISLFALCVTMNWIFCFAWIGIIVVPFLLVIGTHVAIWIIITMAPEDYQEKAANYFVWVLNSDDWSWRPTWERVQKVFWPDLEARLAKTTIYAVVLSTVLSPMIVLGSGLAWNIYGGRNTSSSVADAYKYFYHTEGIELPDILGFLELSDMDALYEVLEDLKNKIELDPWKTLKASKLVLGIQCLVSLLKTALFALNSLLMFITGKFTGESWGVQVTNQAEMMQVQKKGEAEGKDANEINKEAVDSATASAATSTATSE